MTQFLVAIAALILVVGMVLGLSTLSAFLIVALTSLAFGPAFVIGLGFWILVCSIPSRT